MRLCTLILFCTKIIYTFDFLNYRMVIGEEFLVGKTIETLVSWFNRKKAKKDEVLEVLMAFKTGLNNIILHMDLCKRMGGIDYNKLQIYLPDDIEHLNQLLIKFENILGNAFYDEFINFLKYLINYNETINSLYIGMGSELNKKENSIKDFVKKLIKKIDELIKKIE